MTLTVIIVSVNNDFNDNLRVINFLINTLFLSGTSTTSADNCLVVLFQMGMVLVLVLGSRLQIKDNAGWLAVVNSRQRKEKFQRSIS